MILTHSTAHHKRFGDVEPLQGLYFLDPMEPGIRTWEALKPRAVLVHSAELEGGIGWNDTLQKLLVRGTIKKEEYLRLKIYAPKYVKPILNLDYKAMNKSGFKETAITHLDKLAMVPTIDVLVPRMATSTTIMNLKHSGMGLYPNLYFTSVDELMEWKNKGKSSLSDILRLK